VLRDSYRAAHPDHDFSIVVVGRRDAAFEARHPGVAIIWAEDLGIPHFLQAALKFDVVELSTNVKPTALRRLLASHEAVLYIDPDIRVYAPLSPALDALETRSIVVTPHTLTPVMDGKSPCDRDFSRFGAFNLGFVGVRRCDEGLAFLDWWSERCLALGFYEPQTGLAVDQKWVDLAPCFFPGLHVLRDPGMNVAFWNLHERRVAREDGVWRVNGSVPLRFFHFSSFPADDPHAIARNQSRFARGSRPELHPLLDEYAAALTAAGHANYAQEPYPFDHFSDGTSVSPTLRRVFSVHETAFPDEDPFAAGSAVHRFARQRRLAPRGGPPSRATSWDLDRHAAAARVVEHGLSLALRIVGPNRYFTLMKYLAHVSSIRNQPHLAEPRRPRGAAGDRA
jgi:hypothetical protein